MSFSITGVGSGFDISGIVSQLVAVKEASILTPLEDKLSTLETKNTALTSLKGKFSTLQSALQTFTKTIYNSSSDMWNNTKISSTNDAYATATSSGSVAASQIELFIEQIATSTTAKSVHSLGATSKEGLEGAKFINLANGQAKSGEFSMFLNGKEFNIEISDEDSLKDVMDKINTASKGQIKAEVDENGMFSIKAHKEVDGEFVVDNEASLILGSSGDTSNLASALKLHTKVEGGYESAYAVSAVNTTQAMNSAESGLADLRFYDSEGNPAESGKIIINGKEIEVNGDMSINDLISKINSNSDAKVKASYDALTNKVILSATQTGQSNISLASEGTNLLNILGLTHGEGENEILAAGSQELGQNAIVHINGNKVISNSNTITGESSGIANLSLTVKKPTSDYSNNKDDEKSVTLNIDADYSAIKSALEKFVSSYNDVVSTVETMTQSGGKIGRDASLNSILSQMRSITSKVFSGEGEFSMLAHIGISSDKDDLSKLKIDSSKLDKALNENLDSVKKLLSDGYTSKEDNGLFDGMLNTINGVLDVERGYFATQTESVQAMIKSVNSRISRATDRLTNYETRIANQFNKMDSTIAALNSQLSTFTSYLG
ncbi:MAG: flagellar filament capping protein FliD [Candidatus Gastranaerophilales bacterium]|nr:flagellar filament capping protein FliD [Candidatus Gastranaerophilales bacterium]